MTRFFFLFCFILFQSVLRALETETDLYNEELKKGETNLLEITKKAEIYGECWHDALQSLNMECKHLNSELQSKLAMKFTNCFLIDVGKPVCPCGPGDIIASCLTLCSDIIFHTYTHFYTYTHSMCFFIKHKIFESEIAKSTLNLNTLAQKVNSQLDKIIQNNTEHQQHLLDYLNKSVAEIKLLDAEITRSREQTNQLFTDFQKLTANNTNLILKLYNNINEIKIFFIREIHLLYTIVFYLGLFIFLYFISSHKYVKKSRFFLMLINLLFIVIEYYLNYLCLKIALDLESKAFYIWKLRLFNLVACATVLIRYYCTYLDYPVENHNMLVQLTADMSEIKLLLITASQTHGTAYVNMKSAPSHDKPPEQGSMFPISTGYRCVKAVMFLTGFTFIPIVVYMIVQQEDFLPVAGNAYIALGGAILYGLITMLIQYFGIFITALFLSVAVLLIACFWYITSTIWFVAAILMGCSLAGALLTLFWQKVHYGKMLYHRRSHSAPSNSGASQINHEPSSLSSIANEEPNVHYGNMLYNRRSHSASSNSGASQINHEPRSLSAIANEELNEDFSWISQIREDINEVFRDQGAPPSDVVSMRPDGSIRPSVKVKNGYTPPNFIPDNELVNSIFPVDIKTEQRKLQKKLAEIKQLKTLKSFGFVFTDVQEDKINSFERMQNDYNEMQAKM